MDDPGCARCGCPPAADTVALLGWTSEHDEDGTRRTCPRCTRQHCRAIEARLERDWW